LRQDEHTLGRHKTRVRAAKPKGVRNGEQKAFQVQMPPPQRHQLHRDFTGPPWLERGNIFWTGFRDSFASNEPHPAIKSKETVKRVALPFAGFRGVAEFLERRSRVAKVLGNRYRGLRA